MRGSIRRNFGYLLRFGFVVALAAAALAIQAPGPARAQSLDALHSSGVIGEGNNGYAVLRDGGASAAVKAKVATINAKRRQIYQKRAAEQGVTVEQTARVYAGQIIADAPPGTWVQDGSGNWRRK